MEISTEVASLHGYLTSTSPLPLPALAFRPLTWKQTWLSSEAIVEASEQKPRGCIQLESCRHFSPSSTILVSFHGNPGAIYGCPQ